MPPPLPTTLHFLPTNTHSSPYSSLNRRAPPTSSLFADYPSSSRPSSSTSQQQPTYRSQSPYQSYSQSNNTSQSPDDHGHNRPNNGYRPATPNSRGQYATSVLESLESQNDTTATTLLSQKVGQLKQLTMAIGDEIRDSSEFANKVNDGFEGAGVRLKGTMRRMLRMAEKT